MSLLMTMAALCGSSNPGSTPPPVSSPLLIIFTGESNSGGRALNSSATSGELAARSLKILNNTSLTFEPLDIGTNNLIGHHGLESQATTEHSWELQLANRYDAGDFGSRNVYLVKTGQGASKIADWATGVSTTYSGSTAVDNWQTFQDRVNAALTAIEALESEPEVVVFYSQAINDILAATNEATWKTDTKNHIQKIRDFVGAGTKVFMTNFYTSSGMDAYNDSIAAIATEMVLVWVIDTNGLGIVDSYHWNYAGQKTISDSLIDTYLTS